MTAKYSMNAILLLILSVTCSVALAQSEVYEEENEIRDAAASADDLAKTVQNPLANMVTLPFQANWNRGIGDEDRTGININIQPVIPFPGEKWNIITRTIVPVNSVPIGASFSEFGIGDISFSMFFSPNKGGKLTWGVGPAAYLPTASSEVLGSGKFSIGPTGVIFYGTGNWTMGAVASQTWSVAGDDDRDDFSLFFVNLLLNYNLGNGWAIGTAPIITANWEAESGQEWTVPLGLQISKVTHFGHQPVNLLFGYYDNVEHPDNGPESQVRFQLNMLYP